MNVLVFGATGSIGFNSLEVIKKLGHKVVGCTFNKDVKKMLNIINLFKYNFEIYGKSASIFNTVSSYEEMFNKTTPDLVINAIPGFDGLEITLMCLSKKIDIALANKESYVLAGPFIQEKSKSLGVKVFPIDSELSALYELSKNRKIKKIYITASGGPYYNKNNFDLEDVSFYDAKTHPNWKMGYKVSIDCATLMNKCFEIIGSYYIFNNKNIEAIYHPESIVHALVEAPDNSIYTQMSKPDMKLAIAMAISKFNSKIALIEPLSFKELKLNFDVIDTEKWLPIKWAYEVVKNDNRTLAVILNSANDVAVELFKSEKIKFLDIINIIYDCVEKFKHESVSNIESVLNLNSIIKEYILSKY